jgi:zinc/manganese transport system substrate-binding protein
MIALRALSVILGLIAGPAAAQDGVSIVAAENFYGDVAQQIAGNAATVTSILRNPDQDPHLFEASPSVSRLLSAADIVVYNGAGYDPWMPRLLAAAKSAKRQVIVVADLVHRHAEDNPHIWYDPPTMPAYAAALAATLAARDPVRRDDIQRNLDGFLASLRPLQAKVGEMRHDHAGIAVTATEPVFGYMAAALGFEMRNERFQLAVMNNAEPRASDVAGFENDLRQRAVRLLLYNRQATDPMARRLMAIAETAGVPTVGVTETEPAGRHYQGWMMDELDAIDRGLTGAPP